MKNQSFFRVLADVIVADLLDLQRWTSLRVIMKNFVSRPTKLLAAALAVAGVLSVTIAWAAGDVFVLTEKGVDLGISSTTGKIDDLRFIVDLQGEVPVATYVWGTVGSNGFRVRTNEGFWIPFNGDPDKLIDNRIPVVDGKVLFKILDEDIGNDNQGIGINIGYRVGGVLKYGAYAINRDGATP